MTGLIEVVENPRDVSVLTGNYLQESTGRTFHFRALWRAVTPTEAYFVCAFSEPSRGAFGGLERGGSLSGRVQIDADGVPVELLIRSRALSHIEATDFGEWKPPPPSWPGWYGPFL